MADKLDISYYAPAFEIKLDGRNIEKIDPALKKSINSIIITKAIGQSDHIKVEIQDYMEAGKFTWMDNKVFDMGKKINAAVGYTGKMTHKAEAHIQEISTAFTSGLAPTITIEGSHKGFTQLAKKTKTAVYKKKKDSDIVKKIASEVGLRPSVDNTKLTFELKVKRGKTDNLTFIKTLVSQNTQFEFFITEGKLYFRKAAINKKPVTKLKWGEHLVNFSPTANLSKMITGVIALASLKKKTIKVKVGAGKEKKVESKKKLGSQLAKKHIGENIEYITDQPVDSKEELKELAMARLGAKTAEFVTAEASTVGIPELKPGVCVQLEGLGKKFSGKYYITKTVHTIDGSGYKVNFSVRSNVL
jgi:phage protein D